MVTTSVSAAAAASEVCGMAATIEVVVWLTTVRAWLLALTVALGAKLLPVMVIWRGDAGEGLTRVLGGLTAVIIGAAARMASGMGGAADPPGPGLLTTICPVPGV